MSDSHFLYTDAIYTVDKKQWLNSSEQISFEMRTAEP